MKKLLTLFIAFLLLLSCSKEDNDTPSFTGDYRITAVIVNDENYTIDDCYLRTYISLNDQTLAFGRLYVYADQPEGCVLYDEGRFSLRALNDGDYLVESEIPILLGAESEATSATASFVDNLFVIAWLDNGLAYEVQYRRINR